MNPQKWFTSKELWLRGGMIGAVVCVILFLFYLFVYFPVIDTIYAERLATEGSTPTWATAIPLVTGHFFPLFSHFIVEGYSVVPMFCEETESHCVSWVAEEYAPESGVLCTIPWTEEGIPGCCVRLIRTPTSACDKRVEEVGFFALVLMLIGIYFILGALIGWIVQKRKAS